MKIKLKNIFSLIFRTILTLLLLVVVYFIVAVVFSYITVNNDFKPCANNDCVEIYLFTNGVHTDIIVPLKSDVIDWTSVINPVNTKSKRTDYKYMSLGWGDKAFYIETPTWADLKFTTAFNALFYRSSSAIHVSFYKSIQENRQCTKIIINKQQYQGIVNYINSFFKTNNNAQFQLIQNVAYANNDLFYEAKGKYSLFYTCNTWTNDCLKSGGLKACLWTLFDKSIMSKYQDEHIGNQ